MNCPITADFKTEPYRHQYLEYEDHADKSSRALLWSMRTGKTKAIIDSACAFRERMAIDTVIILAPNRVHRNWISKELPAHHWNTVERETLCWDTEFAAATATKLNRRGWRAKHESFWYRAEYALKTDGLAWFAFASQTVTRKDVRKLIARILKSRESIMLVIDESHDYGKPGTSKSKMVRALAKRCQVRRILTASVVTESPLRAWAQYELLVHGALGYDKFADFKQRYATFEKRHAQGHQYEGTRPFARDAEGRSGEPSPRCRAAG